MASKRLFIPFGELTPDGKQFSNNGLTTALNVVPIYQNYVATQLWTSAQTFAPFTNPLYGLQVHFYGDSTWYLYVGEATKLWQVDSGTYTTTDKTRSTGGPYAASSAGAENGWQSTSFGNAVVMTDYVDDPQLLTSPSAAHFVKLAQSGGTNPGMDPKAKFVFPIRGNLFLLNLFLSSPFDGLPAGANPTVGCWSQTENITQYGSYNVTPQLTGTGYQPLNYDLGHITGGIGGDFGLVMMQRGIVRVDGPPYTFRPIVVSEGCRFPNSIIRIGGDVYFWGPKGPCVLRNGQAPVEVLGDSKIVRTLIDNTSGFSPSYSISAGINIQDVSAAADVANNLVWWSFTSVSAVTSAGQVGDLSLIYNISEGRFSFAENASASQVSGALCGVTRIRSLPDLGSNWSPGRDLVGLINFYTGNPGAPPRVWGVGLPNYGGAGAASPMLERSYQQLDPDMTTRVLRVRPIYGRVSLSSAVNVTAYLASKNKPYAADVEISSIAEDTHGWFVFPDSIFADFHKIRFSFMGADIVGSASHGTESITELEGYEVDFTTGGRYSA